MSWVARSVLIFSVFSGGVATGLYLSQKINSFFASSAEEIIDGILDRYNFDDAINNAPRDRRNGRYASNVIVPFHDTGLCIDTPELLELVQTTFMERLEKHTGENWMWQSYDANKLQAVSYDPSDWRVVNASFDAMSYTVSVSLQCPQY
jgi:hypothetical protein